MSKVTVVFEYDGKLPFGLDDEIKGAKISSMSLRDELAVVNAVEDAVDIIVLDDEAEEIIARVREALDTSE